VSHELSQSARKVQDSLQKLGVSLIVKEMPATTRTATDAAAAIGCSVGQIAKTLVFRTQTSRRAVLVIASGSVRVNELRIGELVHEPIEKADAEFVRNATGFAIGGVPPVGHSETIETLIDENLFQYAEIWAAAGTPHAVFRLTPEELKQITRGAVVSV
jgi:prolyl-tRNA editing enzyme YbaK/EbsC (Cys-tRNA(Pro) deacylase)